MYTIYRIFLVLTIAFQLLHGYTTINTSSIHDENGFTCYTQSFVDQSTLTVFLTLNKYRSLDIELTMPY